MTDRELLELLVQKITGMEKGMVDLQQKTTNMEKGMVDLQQKTTNMEKVLNHHGEMFGALIEASEVQKAQHDALQMDLAKLSGEQRESFQALADMYGQHEFELAKLRRKPV